MDRRSFLRGTVAGAVAAVPFTALVTRAQEPSHRGGVRRGHTAGYGPLFPTPDRTTGLPLIALPEGFKYVSFGWTGDPLAGGTPTPGAHDGMAAFAAGTGLVRLVRNHERGVGASFAPANATYNPAAGGGTTTLLFDTHKGELVSAEPSIGGTIRNCAGGLTPWGTWLTCEETVDFAGSPHGYIFEVPADGLGDPTPLRDMGRYSHEAVAVDPATGYVYETEDAGSSSGFYRFVPHVEGELAQGGTLFMLKVKGTHQATLTGAFANGTTFDVEWVQIMTPDNPAQGMPGNFVWSQGRVQGAATFARLEGAWYGNDAKIYVVSTSGGGSGRGQVWEYDPAEEQLRMLFQSPGPDVLNAPDNICVSPRGGLVLCEDGSGEEFLHGLTVHGEIFPFAKNTAVLNGERNGIVGDFRGSEWAGACYSPDGKWLFASLQSPGITFAITGPWKSGAL
jgi:secreted PhoX family phosphatase